jgi:hypothetical protein
MRPPAGLVCHSLIVVSNWRPGSAQAQAAWAMRLHRSRALIVLRLWPVGALLQLPVAVFHHGLDEVVGDPHRVVGVLAGDGGVGLAVEVGGHAPVLDEEAGLVLFDLLPVDEGLDVGMVDVEDDHLGGAAGGAARLDGAGGAVADLEEAHHARALAAAGEELVLAPDGREVGAGAGAELEDACLAGPQVHDPARVHQVVAHAEDEAGVGGGAGVGVGGGGELFVSGSTYQKPWAGPVMP